MTPRALIVEDNPINRELIEYLLQASGFETFTAVNGAIALDVARRERPDIILCDIQMPVMDGMEFARIAKADDVLRDTVLLAITAQAMAGDGDRILAGGFDGYVTKPLNPVDFTDTINRFLPAQLQGRTPAAPPATPEVVPPPSTSRTAILVLDDTPMNLDLKRALLEPHGFEVLTTDSPSQALQLARAHRPALILSDVGMSEGGGFDFIRQVKADPALRDIPFIFISSSHRDEAAARLGLQLGAVRYLLRPIDPARVLAEIRQCLTDGPKR